MHLAMITIVTKDAAEKRDACGHQDSSIMSVVIMISRANLLCPCAMTAPNRPCQRKCKCAERE